MDEQPAPPDSKGPSNKSIPELLKDLSHSIPELIRAEIAAIKAEVREKGSLVGQGVVLIIIALIFLSMTIASGTALAIIVFDLFLPLWLAALVVTLLWLLIAVVLALIGGLRFRKLSSGEEKGSGGPPPANSSKRDKKQAKKQEQARKRGKKGGSVPADAGFEGKSPAAGAGAPVSEGDVGEVGITASNTSRLDDDGIDDRNGNPPADDAARGFGDSVARAGATAWADTETFEQAGDITARAEDEGTDNEDDAANGEEDMT